MVKTVALLRQVNRQSKNGIIQAELEDYESVRVLASAMYESSTTGISPRLRRVVEYVASRLEKESVEELALSASEVGEALKLTRDVAKNAIRNAIKRDFLVDCRDGSLEGANRKFVLGLGDPLPGDCSLPSLEEVEAEMRERPEYAQSGMGGMDWDNGGIPAEETENNELKRQWDSGIPKTGTDRGGAELRGKTDRTSENTEGGSASGKLKDSGTPLSPIPPKSGSHCPILDQDAENKGDRVGGVAGPTENPLSQIPNFSPKPPWYPSPLTLDEVLPLMLGSHRDSFLERVETVLLKRVEYEPDYITPEQRAAQIHCLAALSIANSAVPAFGRQCSVPLCQHP